MSDHETEIILEVWSPGGAYYVKKVLESFFETKHPPSRIAVYESDLAAYGWRGIYIPDLSQMIYCQSSLDGLIYIHTDATGTRLLKLTEMGKATILDTEYWDVIRHDNPVREKKEIEEFEIEKQRRLTLAGVPPSRADEWSWLHKSRNKEGGIVSDWWELTHNDGTLICPLGQRENPKKPVSLDVARTYRYSDPTAWRNPRDYVL